MTDREKYRFDLEILQWSRRDLVLLFIIGLLGLSVSYLAYDFTLASEIEQNKINFNRASEQELSVFSHAIADCESNIEFLQYYYQASQAITRKEFQEFVKGIFRQERGIEFLQWIPRILDSDRKKFVEEARLQGFSDFDITQKGADGQLLRRSQHKEYFPVFYMEPLSGNEDALGFDIASDPELIHSMNLSGNSGRIIATQRLKFGNDQHDKSGFVVFVPVYRKGAPTGSIEERRENLEGFYLAAFKVAEFIGWVFREHKVHGMDLYILDVSVSGEKRLIYGYPVFNPNEPYIMSPERESALRAGFYWDRTIDVHGRNWLIMCVPSPGNDRWSKITWYPFTILITGLMCTGLVVTYLSFLHIEKIRTEQFYTLKENSRRRLEEESIALRNAIIILKDKQKALKESERRFRQIAESVGEWIWEVDTEGLYTYCSSGVKTILGYSPEEMVGKRHFYDSFTPDIKKEYRDLAFEAFGRKESFRDFVNPNLRKDGAIAILETTGIPVLASDGSLKGYRGSDKDITTRLEAEKTRNLLNTAIEQASESIFITDKDGLIQYVNPAFELITGYSRNDILGENPRLLKSGEHDQAFYRDMWETISSGNVWHGSIINKDRNKSLIYSESTLSPVKDPSGIITNYVAVNRNITREHLLQSQLSQSQKMEAIGTLAGGIAHDFNNIIYAITGYAELAIVKSSGDVQTKAYLEKILKAAGRAGDMVSQILSFSRKSEQEKKLLYVAPIVKECLKFLRGAIPSTIEINQRIDPDLQHIEGDPTQIYQVLMNLCANAVHSIGDAKGTLSVELTSETLDERFRNIHGLESAGKYVKLVVKDSGAGIPDQLMDRIFEPYFTTKAAGEGTGLGLSVIHEIVRSHNGAITVESQSGEGATFNVFFPVVEGQEKIEEGPASDDVVTCGGKILWVDDEVVLIQMYKATLESLGFEVTTTSNPLHALELFRQTPESFDAIITDLTMPKMTGMELAGEINSIRPDIPIIICTGFDQFSSEFNTGHFGIQAVLRKPVPRAELARTITKILDRECGP